MARVPYSPVQTATAQIEPTPNRNVPSSPADFGGLIAQGEQKAGADVSEGTNVISQALLQRQGLVNETLATNAETDYMTKLGALQGQYRQNEGLNAPAALPKYTADVQALRQSLSQSLPGLGAQRAFNMLAQRHEGYALLDANNYADTEIKKADTQSAHNAALTAAQRPGDYNVAADDTRFGSTLGDINSQVVRMMHNQGWDAPGTGMAQDPKTGAVTFNETTDQGRQAKAVYDQTLNQFRGAAWEARIHSLADDPSRGNVNTAMQVFQANRDKIPPEAQAKLSAYLEPKVRSAQALQGGVDTLSKWDGIYQGQFTKGGAQPGVPAAGDVHATAGPTPTANALLDALGGGEASNYNIRYDGSPGGAKFDDLSKHPNIAAPITTGPDAGSGRTSTGAGRYQFLKPTYDQQAGQLGLTDFSPASQDKAAWNLASSTYQQKTGRNLQTDLDAGKTDLIAGALHDQWPSTGPDFNLRLTQALQAAKSGTPSAPGTTQPAGQANYIIGQPPGLVKAGNIDLNTRPTIQNQNGTISTVRSIVITIDDGRAVVIPTVVNGRVVSNEEADAYFRKTGQNLGIFKDEASADGYATALHNQQSHQYGQAPPTFQSKADFYRANSSKILSDVDAQSEQQHPGDAMFAAQARAKVEQRLNDTIRQQEQAYKADSDLVWQAVSGQLTKGQKPSTEEQVMGISPQVRDAVGRMMVQNPMAYNNIMTHTLTANARGTDKDSVAYGKGYWDVYSRVTSQPTAPGHISNPDDLYALAGPNLPLNTEGVEKLRGMMTPKGAEEQSNTEMHRNAVDYMRRHMTYEIPEMPSGPRDPKGMDAFNLQAIPALDKALADGKAKGLTYSQMLSKDSKDFVVDRVMTPFMRTPAEKTFDFQMQQKETAEAGGVPGGPGQTAMTLTTKEGIKAAYDAHQITREEAGEFLLKGGFAGRGAGTTPPAPPPIAAPIAPTAPLAGSSLPGPNQ